MDSDSPFLNKLPAEIRNKIYHEVASNMKQIGIASYGVRQHPLSMTCKQIKSEFEAVLDIVHPGYSSGTVVPKSIARVFLHLKGFSPAQLSAKLSMLSPLVKETDRKFELKLVACWPK